VPTGTVLLLMMILLLRISAILCKELSEIIRNAKDIFQISRTILTLRGGKTEEDEFGIRSLQTGDRR
jgi:hypothetical protein